MNTTQITDSLSHLFHTEGHRIVFWHDPDQEFVDLVPELNLDGVRLIRLDQESTLELKVRLELEDQDGKYLLYSLHAVVFLIALASLPLIISLILLFAMVR